MEVAVKLPLKEALKYAHDDLPESRDYDFKLGDRILFGKMLKTACGHWFSACVDDPDYVEERWSMNRDDQRPTCPKCVEKHPYEHPGMLLIVLGGLGVPQIVRVTDEDTWEGVFGFSKGRTIAAEGKTVIHVLQDGDVIEDIKMIVRGDELVSM